MPYIDPRRRAPLREGDHMMTAGELNFMLTELIVRYINDHDLSYRRINDVLGALEGAKLEFYRRVAAPYEEGKIETNGDVY